MPGLNNLNSVLIEGTLIEDPEVSYTPKGVCQTSFTLASQRFFMEGEEKRKEISFFQVKTEKRLAEVCGEYLKKGRGVRVVGRLKQERWDDPVAMDDEGKPIQHSKVLIMAEHVEFKPVVKRPVDETVEKLIDEV